MRDISATADVPVDTIDVPMFDDTDFGDAALGVLRAQWGGWEDPESPDLTYSWALMRVDPRQTHIVGGMVEVGSALADVVNQLIDQNPGVFDQPPAQGRVYSEFQGAFMHEVDNGVVISTFTEPSSPGYGNRDDVELLTGFIYYSIVRVENEHGLHSVVSSDGILFDSSDPCVSKPVPGLNPLNNPTHLSTKDEITAAWGAVTDPRFQRPDEIPFDCSEPEPDADANATLIDVPIVPLWTLEWQVRKSKPYELPQDVVLSSNTTNATDVVGNNTIPSEDVVTDEIIVNRTRMGGEFASPWSSCCSAYSSNDPPTIREEWDWRPVKPRSRFGHGVALARGRFVAAGSEGAVTVFDVLHPASAQYDISAEEVHAAAGVAATTAQNGEALMTVAGHDMFVFVADAAMSVRDLPPELAHTLDNDATDTPLSSPNAMAVLASLAVTDALFSGAVEGSVYTATRFAERVTTRGRLVAVATTGVWKGSHARGVTVLQVTSEGVTSRVGTVLASSDLSFGEALALAAAPAGTTGVDAMLVLSTTQACRLPLDGEAGQYSGGCANAGSSTAPAASIAAFAVSASSLTAVASVAPPPSSHPSASFGTSIAAAGAFVAVGDPEARDGLGEVTVLEATASGLRAVCTVPGMSDDGGFGYSVSVSDAAEEGKTGSAGYARNHNTALVFAGSPGSNSAVVLRVNASDDAEPCRVAASARQSGLFKRNGEQLPPLYGAGTAVAIGGGVVVFSSPFAHTWPTASVNNSFPGSVSGTGRLFGAAFCWSGDVRTSGLAWTANVPSVCTPCGDDAVGQPQWSAGGVSGTCESCAGVQCTDKTESYFTATAHVELDIEQQYQVDVIATSRSGREVTRSSDWFKVDWTPPVGGIVRDTALYPGFNMSSTEDIRVQTNASYLATTWCCFEDHESEVVSYQVAFGTSPDNMDVMPFTPAGSNETFVLDGIQLQTGSRYYACVVASNNLGLFSEPTCSDGFMYDDTAPTMLIVRDGFQAGHDADAQPFTDILMASYEGEDLETRIMDYVLRFGSTPGAEDFTAPFTGGNSTFNGVFAGPFVAQPSEGAVVYATVYAVNEVGLASDSMSSDGMVVGKSDIVATPGSDTTMLMDTIALTDDNVTTLDPPTTIASVHMPEGAVDTDTRMFGGAVAEEDINSGAAINASATTPRNVC